ncbi:IS5 family transposase [Mesorhizobium sp. M0924]|uniref:IS5 family transposase n=1 Tax=unclassified Mesorhizobium TaxID=325217 RepID=UPI003336B525
MKQMFWLNDDAWAAIEPQLPKNLPGARRVDDRRVISGILHVLKTGCRWKDCPAEYGPPTTIYNRFNRWSRRQLWTRILDALVVKGVLALSASIDSTYIKAHRSAHGGKGGPKAQAIGPSRGGQTTKIHAVTDLLGRPAVLRLTAGNVADITMAKPLLDAAGPVRCLIADKGYDANALRKHLKSEGAQAVIPGRSNRKATISYDETRYKGRWRIEAAFCRLKDFRRIATRYDKLARNFLSAVALATLIAFWV